LRPSPETIGDRIDAADPDSEEHLLYGWFPAEHVDGGTYRWAGVQAGALVRLKAPARRLRLDYHQVPVDTGGVELSMRRLASSDPLAPAWDTRLLWRYIERDGRESPALAAER